MTELRRKSMSKDGRQHQIAMELKHSIESRREQEIDFEHARLVALRKH